MAVQWHSSRSSHSVYILLFQLSAVQFLVSTRMVSVETYIQASAMYMKRKFSSKLTVRLECLILNFETYIHRLLTDAEKQNNNDSSTDVIIAIIF
jgi:hypothetical protein